MRTYWIETLLIAALFTTVIGFTLAQAEGGAVPNYVYGDKSGVVPGYVYGGNGDQSNMNVGVTPLGTAITVQPLNAPNNPYASQYNNFDRWMYRNLDNGYLRSTITSAGGNLVINRDIFSPAASDLRVPVLVDENGFMVPSTSPNYIIPQFVQTVPLVNPADQTAAGATAPSGKGKETATETTVTTGNAKVAVKGETRIRPKLSLTYTKPMTDAEYKQFRAAQLAAAAKVLPTIPSWVDQLHPATFELLPNGGVLVPVGDAGGATTVTVYSPTGDKLGVVQNQEGWHKYFADNYDDIVSQAKAKGWDVVENNGYIVLRDRASRKIQAVFDWDGKPVELTTEMQQRPYFFTPLRWDNVAPVAVEQRRVPAAGREPDAQATTGTTHQSGDNNPAPDNK